MSTRNPIKDQVAVVGDRQHRLLARQRPHVALPRPRGGDRGDPRRRADRGRHRRRGRHGRARRPVARDRRLVARPRQRHALHAARAGGDVLVRRRGERGRRPARATPCSSSTRSCGCRGRRARPRTTRSVATCRRAWPRSRRASPTPRATRRGRAGTSTSTARRATRSPASRSTSARTRRSNPLAAIQTPLTMEDYYAARMIREPLCMLDMDLPVDGADAFVLTTAERARRPRAAAGARARDGHRPRRAERRGPAAEHPPPRPARRDRHAQGEERRVDRRRRRVLPVRRVHRSSPTQWIENAGWCGPGEAGAFLEQHWDDASNRVLINGRVPMNPHGGSLSEGATARLGLPARGGRAAARARPASARSAGRAVGARHDRRVLLQLPGRRPRRRVIVGGRMIGGRSI